MSGDLPDDLRAAIDAADWVDAWTVEPNYRGWRLDRYLAEKIDRATRTQVVRIVRESDVWVGGRRARPATIVQPGDVVRIPRIERADPDTPPLDSIAVLHDAGELLVVDKPPGMLVHRTGREATRTVERWLDLRGEGRVEAAHRLDRETSGVLVCARGLDAIRRWRSAFESGAVTKVYAAAVDDPDGRWQPGAEATFDTPLGLQAGARVNVRMGVGTLPCATHARCLVRSGERALLRVTIDQGRQHQIRVHLAMAGTPVVGDKLYALGDDFFLAWSERPGDPALVAALPTRWHALHSWRFVARENGARIDVGAPLPARIAALVPGAPTYDPCAGDRE